MGDSGDPATIETEGILQELVERTEPLMGYELAKWAASSALGRFVKQNHASILVPLVSSNRVVGLLTVGSDRSGQGFDRETREFLGVLGHHAASEFHKYELLASLVETREAEAFKSFSTFLLHDLKNFASTLSLIAKNASRHQGNPEFQLDAFQSVFDTAEKMKRLCNNLRTFSSTLAANRKPADLNEIVNGAAADLNAGLSRQLRLELADLPPVFVDADQVTRLLQNLLLNAREAISPEGSIIVSTRHVDDMVDSPSGITARGCQKNSRRRSYFCPSTRPRATG